MKNLEWGIGNGQQATGNSFNIERSPDVQVKFGAWGGENPTMQECKGVKTLYFSGKKMA